MRLSKAGLVAFVIGGLLWSATGVAAASGHADVQSVLSASQDAIHLLDNASRLTTDDPDAYKKVARKVLQELTGGTAPMQDNTGFHNGAIGLLAQVRDQSAGKPWQPAIQSAWANLTVAALQLHDSLRARDLESFQRSATRALEALIVAHGRDSTTGSLGGLEGVLATTELGVPDGAKVVDGCNAPAQAPSYGVTNGYLIYLALPTNAATTALPESVGVHDISVENGILVLHTAATAVQPSVCGSSHAAAGAQGLFTEAQAEQGQAIYTKTCAVCHGDHMEGKSAPPIAGPAFMKKAEALEWTVGNLRTLIVGSMPRDNPGSLSPTQYADVIAFLLASNCFPAGQTPFPTQPTPQIRHAALKRPPATATHDTCPVQVSSQSE